MKFSKIEEKILKFIEKHIFEISFFTISILALIIRALFISAKSGDYIIFLEPWFDELKKYGGLPGLRYYTGNYNYPYITILAIFAKFNFDPLISIKMFSILFDYILAIVCSKIVEELFVESKNKKIYSQITYTLILFLPTVIINGSLWGQCDVIYTTFIAISILFLIQEKYLKSFIFLGISFAFKLQFIFILPVYVIIYVRKKRFPISYFLIIPLMNFILCIPALFNGVSVIKFLKQYIEQAGTYKDCLSMLFPGVYNLISNPTENDYIMANPNIDIGFFAIMLILAVCTIVLFMIIYKKVRMDKDFIILLSIWSVCICTFFMPYMHERYLFVGDVLSVVYFISSRDFKKIYIPIGVSMVSMYGYIRLMIGSKFLNITILSLLNMIIVIVLTFILFKKILEQNDNTVVSNLDEGK